MWYIRLALITGAIILFLGFPDCLPAQEPQMEETEPAPEEGENDPYRRTVIFGPSIEELLDDPAFDFDENEIERSVRYLSNTGIDFGGGFEAVPYYTNLLYSKYTNLSAKSVPRLPVR